MEVIIKGQFTYYVHNKFVYIKRKERNGRKYFVCKENGCFGTVQTTAGDDEVHIGREHNHSADANKVAALRLRSTLVERACASTQRPSLLFAQEAARNPEGVQACSGFGPEAKSMWRYRRKERSIMSQSSDLFPEERSDYAKPFGKGSCPKSSTIIPSNVNAEVAVEMDTMDTIDSENIGENIEIITYEQVDELVAEDSDDAALIAPNSESIDTVDAYTDAQLGNVEIVLESPESPPACDESTQSSTTMPDVHPDAMMADGPSSSQQEADQEMREHKQKVRESSTHFFHFIRLMQLFPDVHPATLHTVMIITKNDFFLAVDRLLYARRCKHLYQSRRAAEAAVTGNSTSSYQCVCGGGIGGVGCMSRHHLFHPQEQPQQQQPAKQQMQMQQQYQQQGNVNFPRTAQQQQPSMDAHRPKSVARQKTKTEKFMQGHSEMMDMQEHQRFETSFMQSLNSAVPMHPLSPTFAGDNTPDEQPNTALSDL